MPEPQHVKEGISRMRFILLIVSLTVSFSVFAGSRNGYRLVFFDDSSSKNPAITKLFTDYFNVELPSQIYRCEKANRFIDIDVVYLRQRPKAITPKLIKDSIDSDKKALEKLRKTLRTFRNSEIDQGFDGLVVFKSEGTSFELTAISSIRNGYKKTAKITNQQGLNADVLKSLFCESLADLDYAYQGK